MRIGSLLTTALTIANGAIADNAPLDARNAKTDCNVRYASSVLAHHSGGKFCSSLIFPHGAPTKTKSRIITVAGGCVTHTHTRVLPTTATETTFSFSQLPQITITAYASTVLVTTGTYPIVNKRAAPETPAYHGPPALKTCAPSIIKSACSSLVDLCTKTITKTTTTTKHCTTSTTETSFSFVPKIVTTTIFGVANPPPDTVSVTSVLTTTVPAACAGPFYVAPPGVPAGNVVEFATYPDFPSSDVACCAYCWEKKPNCIASVYDSNLATCELEVRASGKLPGANAQCPNGIFDFDFGEPNDTLGNILPGPCGK